MSPMSRRWFRRWFVYPTALLALAATAHAAPYASGVSISGVDVSFYLNEPADSLAVSVNGGAPILLDGTSRGLKGFALTSPTDTFSIYVVNHSAVGYSIPTGGSIGAATGGLSQPTNLGGFNLISQDSNSLVRFNSPRGVTVAIDPNNPQFGTTYISNSASGTTVGVVRTVGDGLYALRSDQSDAFGFGNTAVSTTFETAGPSANSPFRLSVGGDHNVYIADFSDANGGVYRMSPTLTTPTRVLAGHGGPSTLPGGQNHGSTLAVVLSGSASGATLYTLDEDLTTSHVTGAGSNTDKNSAWRYDIGDSPLPYTAMPTRLGGPAMVTGATSDLDRGLDGKFYLSQFRSAGNEAGITILSEDGSTVMYDSLTASRALLGNPTAVDIFRNVQAMAVSPDQKFLALLLNNSDVGILPLDANGIPDLANRLVIDTGTDVNSGRDIAFDAAGNIHYVSSGQALYRVLSPGGTTTFATSWDGNEMSFSNVPEPSTFALLGASALLFARRQRGRRGE